MWLTVNKTYMISISKINGDHTKIIKRMVMADWYVMKGQRVFIVVVFQFERERMRGKKENSSTRQSTTSGRKLRNRGLPTFAALLLDRLHVSRQLQPRVRARNKPSSLTGDSGTISRFQPPGLSTCLDFCSGLGFCFYHLLDR